MHKYIVTYVRLFDDSQHQYLVQASNPDNAEEQFWIEHELNVHSLRIIGIIPENHLI